jgi:NAD(P)-dependent dehydrogenase (short-subunit alcohol dehydrogenase family)
MLAQYKLNCLSSLWGYQAVIPRWQDHQRGGQVVDVSSVGGKSGFPFSVGYVAAKHALSGLGDVARQELAGSGIMITTVYPGSTLSDFGKALTDRTGGAITSSLSGLRRKRSFLVRLLSAEQPTEHVARCIVGAMLRPRPTVYPHPGATFAAILNNFWPGFVLAQIVKLRRGI